MKVRGVGGPNAGRRGEERGGVDALSAAQQHPRPRPFVRPFETTDSDRLILAPYVSRFYSPVISGPLTQQGYRIETLPPPDRESVEVGLKYCNNEICYPGIIYIGDLIKTLQSGRYDLNEVSAGSWQTGGQCRASCILRALKRAMISAGFEDVPVVALTTNGSLENQPGFVLDMRDYIRRAVLAAVYADGVAEMYYALAARERYPGEAVRLADKHMSPLADGSLPLERRTVLDRLAMIADEFNAVEREDQSKPAVGVVGEIFVKYNSFSNFGVAEWLMEQGLEVVVPPITEFFAEWLLAPRLQIRSNLKRPGKRWLVAEAVGRYVESVLADSDAVLDRLEYRRERHGIHGIARRASEVMSLAHQYGESWLIAGEIGELVDSGVTSVLCLQPFGCIANQVVARGIERRLKENYSGINLLFLDSDAGISEVNYFNRLHFFASQARSGA